MSHMAMQTNALGGGQSGGANPLDIVLKHLDTVPHMIYGALMIVLITFNGQIGVSTAAFVDSALGRVLGIGLVLIVVNQMGWSYGLLTALAFLLIIHASPRLAATGIEQFEDLKRHEAKGNKWFVEKVLGENPAGITSDDANTEAVQDDSERAMSHGGR
jgi:hypothetical protein